MPKTLRTIAIGSLILTMALATTIGVYLFVLLYQLPHLDSMVSYRPLLTTHVLDNAGSSIGEFYQENRDFVPFQDIPPLIMKAFIASEDQKFYEHSGLDFQGIMRAFIANFKSGKIVQGGSTITQQVTKSILLTPERTFTRKIKEAYLSFKIENKFTKNEILTIYLNQIYLGHGAYGIKKAAWHYFRKDIHQLDVAEISLLAGLPQAPSRYSPLHSPSSAKTRQQYVLNQLAISRVITQAEADKAFHQPLTIHNAPQPAAGNTEHFVEYIRRETLKILPEESLLQDGWQIKTSLNSDFQNQAQTSLMNGLRAIDKRRGYRGPLEHQNIQNKNKILENLKTKNFLANPKSFILTAEGTLQPVLENPQGQPSANTVYQCLVLNVDDTQKQATISNGNTTGFISLDSMSWARPVNPFVHSWAEPLKKVSDALKPGDIILGRIVKPSPIEYELEQEPLIEGALLSVHIPSGEILAMAGGKNFSTSQFNRTYQAMRQLGSTFKPIIYTKALEVGLTPNTIIIDAPIVYEEKREKNLATEQAAKAMDKSEAKNSNPSQSPEGTPDDEDKFVWKPDNYGEVFMGDTTLRQALVDSRNIPTIKVVQSLGVGDIIEFAKKLGMEAVFPEDLSLSLGSISTSLWQIMQPYGIFANQGRRVIFHALKSIQPLQTGSAPVKRQTPKLLAPPTLSEPVISHQLSYMITYLLQDAVKYGTGASLNKLGPVFAGKTGTTNDFVDAWFIGYTSDVLTGVWVGFDQPEYIGIGEAGAIAAGPIWVDYMRKVVTTYPIREFIQPPHIELAWMHPTSGKISSYKEGRIQVPFLEGTIPKNPILIGGFGKMSPEKLEALHAPAETLENSTVEPMEDPKETTEEEKLFGQY